MRTFRLSFLVAILMAANALGAGSQSVWVQINDLETSMEKNCAVFNYQCRNKYLTQLVVLHETQALNMYKQYRALRAEVRYKNTLSHQQHEQIISDFDSLEKFNKFLAVRGEQVANEFRRADESIFTKSSVGKISSAARLNNVLKNQIKVMARYKSEITSATDFLKNLSSS